MGTTNYTLGYGDSDLQLQSCRGTDWAGNLHESKIDFDICVLAEWWCNLLKKKEAGDDFSINSGD